MFSSVEGMIGKYFSERWARQTILGQTDEDITRIAEEIKKEAEPAEAPPEETPEETPTDETPPEETPEETPPEKEVGAKPKGSKPNIPADFRLGPSGRKTKQLNPEEELPEIPDV
jgi:hypothetical protein